MSFIALSAPVAPTAPRANHPVNRGAFIRTAIVTALVAALSNVVVYFFGDALIGYDPAFVELGSAIGIAFSTIVPALVAALLYAGLLRTVANPARVFTIISAIVFVVTLVPDFIFIPGEPGASTAQTAVLIAMHVVAAAVIVPMLTAFPRD